MKIKNEDKFDHTRPDGISVSYDANARSTTIKAYSETVRSETTISGIVLLKDSTGKIVGIKIPD